MKLRKKIIITFTFLALTLAITAPKTKAKGKEFSAVCNHIKTKYRAKKVKIPFMWLARFAVKIVRPAGVKSFKVTIYKDLKYAPETLNEEMKLLMSDSFDNRWSPILRIRAQKGNQVYMNIREAGKNLKIVLVSIGKKQAVVVRAKFNPDKLAKFIENPKIFGISLNGSDKHADLLKSDSNDNERITYEEDTEETNK